MKPNLFLLSLLLILAIGCRDSHYQKGQIYLREQRLDEAEQEFKRALDKDPSNVQAYIGLGTVHTAKKDYEQALVELQKAIESDPNVVGAYNQIAKVYRIRGQLDLAIQTCEKGIAIAPESASTYKVLGDTYLQKFNIYRQKRDASEAEEALK